MTRCPAPQGSGDRLKRPTRQRRSRPLHAGLQGADLELACADVGRYVELAGRGEGGVGGLYGEGAGIVCFGAFAVSGGVLKAMFAFGRGVGGHCGGGCHP